MAAPAHPKLFVKAFGEVLAFRPQHLIPRAAPI